MVIKDDAKEQVPRYEGVARLPLKEKILGGECPPSVPPQFSVRMASGGECPPPVAISGGECPPTFSAKEDVLGGECPPKTTAMVPESLKMREWSSSLGNLLSSASTWEESVKILCDSLGTSPTSFGACFRGELWNVRSEKTNAHFAPLGPSPDSSDVFPIEADVALKFCMTDLNLNDEAMLSLLRLMFSACNFLSMAAWTSTPLRKNSKNKINSGQKGMIKHFVAAAERFKSLPSNAINFGEVAQDLRERRVDYNGNIVSVRRDLSAAKVIPAWPAVGLAATCPVERLLKGELLDDLEDPQRCLRPVSEWPTETPVSRVHASDEEWYKIVKAGHERGIFAEVAESDIFVNNLGDKVLAGAMGVDKIKETEQGTVELLRFISILCPINAYFRKLRGQSKNLPYLGQLNMALLGAEDQVIVDSEDMESCFNIYKMNNKWPGMFTFNKRVPQSAIGGDPNVMIWVGLCTIPMGCSWAVDVAQELLRELVFGEALIPLESEMIKSASLPEGEISILRLDGYDHVRLAKDALISLQEVSESDHTRRFRESCERLNISLNPGKES